jgi:hypothetical protein
LIVLDTAKPSVAKDDRLTRRGDNFPMALD